MDKIAGRQGGKEMVFRPVFVSDDVTYVKTVNTKFDYYRGVSKAQRQRSSESLHDAFKKNYPDVKVLEISNFSQDTLGIQLSAFNLLISLKNGKKVPVEVAFQSGKVFEHGGPYKDLLNVSPKMAKTDPRLSESGKIIAFDFEDRSLPAEPVTLFYTWLYVKALNENKELAEQLCEFHAFTDIAFNPKKSINCQAFACAVYVSLRRKRQLEQALENIDFFSNILRRLSPNSGNPSKNEMPKRKIVHNQPTEGTPAKKVGNHKFSFKKYDSVIHPKYGEGIIKCIKKSETGYRTLVIAFKNPCIEKILSEDWVRDNCNYGTDFETFYERIEIDNESKQTTDFEYYQSKLHPFTDQMKLSIRLAEQGFDNQVIFVVLGDNVMMVFASEDSISLSLNEIRRNVNRKCSVILRNHPNFKTIAIDDKMFLVIMWNAVCIVPNNKKVEKLNLGEAINHRQEILDACENPTIYGIVVGKEFRQHSPS